ncbi:universal stress protein [Millisia brevis]|uniref:universal stress protein n=1 Tax=Millisia brevis TaxID=264148 RepID=UPI00082F5EA1|nr:universal stress protein [Millisia brevis]
MPIIVGYTDTPGGHDALVLGARFARAGDRRVNVVTAYPEDGGGLAAAASDPRWIQDAEKTARRRFANARKRLARDAEEDADSENKVKYSIVGPGKPAEILLDEAKQVGADLIVVGSVGHGLLGRLAVGRTVHSLLASATVPVVIAPRGYRHTVRRQFRVLAVAVDNTDKSLRAVDFAADLAGRIDAQIECVTVVATDGARPEGARQVARARSRVPTDLDAYGHVLVDHDIPGTLADLPLKVDALIVVARGYSIMRRLLLGNVIGRLVRGSSYPVVVLPNHEHVVQSGRSGHEATTDDAEDSAGH